MARPERNDVDYFPHPVHSGKSMYFIKNKYRNEGYAIWYTLLEELGSANYHYLDLSDKVQLMYTSSRLMTTEILLNSILTDLADLGEINKYLWDKKKIVFSETFVESISDAYERRKNNCITIEGLCKHLHVKLEQLHLYCSEISSNKPQTKLKESKLNKSVYLESLKIFRNDWCTSNEGVKWIESLFKEYSTYDVKKMLANIYDYWSTDEGFAKKKKSKTVKIDWKATFKNGMNMDFNAVMK
jgi:hypothetical protein